MSFISIISEKLKSADDAMRDELSKKATLPDSKIDLILLDQPEVSQEFKNLTYELPTIFNKGLLVGGSVRKMAHGLPLGFSDLDFFFRNKEDYIECFKIMEKLVDKKFVSKFASTFVYKGFKVQLICKDFYQSIGAVLNNFDFVNCQYAMSNGQFYATQAALDTNESKNLCFNPLRENLDLPSLMPRMVKYLNYGFTPTTETYSKFLSLLVENNRISKYAINVKFGTMSAASEYEDEPADYKEAVADKPSAFGHDFIEQQGDSFTQFLRANIAESKLFSSIVFDEFENVKFAFVDSHPLFLQDFLITRINIYDDSSNNPNYFVRRDVNKRYSELLVAANINNVRIDPIFEIGQYYEKNPTSIQDQFEEFKLAISDEDNVITLSDNNVSTEVCI